MAKKKYISDPSRGVQEPAAAQPKSGNKRTSSKRSSPAVLPPTQQGGGKPSDSFLQDGPFLRFVSGHLTFIQVLLLMLITAVVYGATLDVPFYLDDFSSIKENPLIYSWNHQIRSIFAAEPLRWITYLSFALNYQFHAFQVAGYHVVNIVIHALNGLMVLFLVKAMLKTPAFEERFGPSETEWIAFFAAALFVVHPLHIQAVTYIVQRAASLAALFYLASMLGYLRARIASSPAGRIGWGAICLLSMLCAFFTKQNTATLPAAFVLMELLFWRIHRKKLILIALGGALVMLGAWILFSKALHLDPFSLQSMAVISQETQNISRSAYMMTQFRVLWTYLRLFVYPIGLCIDYQSYPIYTEFWQTAVLYSFLGHVLLLCAGLWCIRRYPMVSFGLFFYYLAHLVESSVLPITDVVFEHRAYLPDAGLCSMLGWLGGRRWQGMPSSRIPRTISIAILVLLGIIAWQRNEVWRNPIALWQQNASQIPENGRAWITLGKYLLESKRYEEAYEVTKRSAEVRTDEHGDRVLRFDQEALVNMIIATVRLKRYEEAKKLIGYALESDMTPINRYKLYINYANMMRFQGKLEEAEKLYRKALDIFPEGVDAKLNLAALLGMMKRYDEAETIVHQALRIDPNSAVARKALEALQKVKMHPSTTVENPSDDGD